MMCRVLKVSRSSYYYWLRAPKSQYKEQIKELKVKLQEVYFRAKGRYGSPRIKEELCQTGTKVSTPTVAKYMKEMSLRSKLARKFRVTTNSNHKEPVADNLLKRDFFSVSSLRKLVSDITYIPTKNGFIYLTIVMDLFNRDIIAWNLSPNMTAKDTVLVAINNGAGNCWDNAVAESFFKTLKTKLIYGTKSIGAKQMRTKIFEYIEIWHRKQRRHSYLGYQTIEEFNNQYLKQSINNVA